MAQDDFETLLKRMPEIAEAVNAFESESLQREALQALVASFRGAGGSGPPEQAMTGQSASKAGATEATNGKPSGRKKSSSGKSSYTPSIIRNLDLNPKDKQSFREFIVEKMPGSNQDKYAVIVYYLQHVLGITNITLDHIATVFRVTPDWKEPTNVPSGLATTASRKGTIDTRKYDDLKTTAHGRNFVEHELPPREAED